MLWLLTCKQCMQSCLHKKHQSLQIQQSTCKTRQLASYIIILLKELKGSLNTANIMIFWPANCSIVHSPHAHCGQACNFATIPDALLRIPTISASCQAGLHGSGLLISHDAKDAFNAQSPTRRCKRPGFGAGFGAVSLSQNNEQSEFLTDWQQMTM